MGPKLSWDPQIPFYLVSFGRAGPGQVSPLGLCAAPRKSGDADTGSNNLCMSPVVYKGVPVREVGQVH